MADELGIGWAYWSNDPDSSGVIDGDGKPTLFAKLLAWDAARHVLSVWADPDTPSHTVTVKP